MISIEADFIGYGVPVPDISSEADAFRPLSELSVAEATKRRQVLAQPPYSSRGLYAAPILYAKEAAAIIGDLYPDHMDQVATVMGLGIDLSTDDGRAVDQILKEVARAPLQAYNLHRLRTFLYQHGRAGLAALEADALFTAALGPDRHVLIVGQQVLVAAYARAALIKYKAPRQLVSDLEQLTFEEMEGVRLTFLYEEKLGELVISLKPSIEILKELDGS